mmetsp:Transcript_47924/g.112202  ORF Transcript_47924/g.112202 Transcript_47924/m.112202 type:complete len:217 (-) Transcript_47924:199-849(-)
MPGDKFVRRRIVWPCLRGSTPSEHRSTADCCGTWGTSDWRLSGSTHASTRHENNGVAGVSLPLRRCTSLRHPPQQSLPSRLDNCRTLSLSTPWQAGRFLAPELHRPMLEGSRCLQASRKPQRCSGSSPLLPQPLLVRAPSGRHESSSWLAARSLRASPKCFGQRPLHLPNSTLPSARHLCPFFGDSEARSANQWPQVGSMSRSMRKLPGRNRPREH